MKNFKQIDIQKLDSTGNLILNEEYILSYKYSDGWTERVFSIGIFIDIYYECKIDLSFYHQHRKNKKTFAQKIEKQFEIEIPNEIKSLIELLVIQDELNLKNIYADTFIEDTGNEDFVINHKNKSHNIGIGILTKKLSPDNKSEEIFFQLKEEFFKWKEQIYKKTLVETI